MGVPASSCGARALRTLRRYSRGGVEEAEVVEGAAAAEVMLREGDAEAGVGEDLVGGSHGGGVEVVVEGVGPEEDVGGGGGLGGAGFAGEGFAEAGEGSVGVDVEEGFDDFADAGGVVDGVDEARREGGEVGPEVDASEGVVGERAVGAFVVVGEELGLVGGHVDGDGALGLAGFAGEAEVEGFADLLVLPLLGEDFALHELPEEMGAAAGGVELFAGGHEAGAHGSGVGFAAGSDAYAAEGGGGEGAVVFGEGEVSFGLPGVVVGAEAEVFVDLVAVDHFVGVEAVVRVPEALEGAEGVHEFGAEHLGEECAAGLAVAVFAGEGAAVGEGDVGGAVHELAEVEDALFGFEVEGDAHVDAALAEVSVHGAVVAVLLHEGDDVAEVGAELRGVDGGVFPALPAGADAGDEGGGSEAGFADGPDAGGFGLGVDAGVGDGLAGIARGRRLVRRLRPEWRRRIRRGGSRGLRGGVGDRRELFVCGGGRRGGGRPCLRGRWACG